MGIRRLFGLLLSAIALPFLTGCEKYVTEQYYTQGATIETYYVTAKARDWRENGVEGKEGYYMYQSFKFPEIDNSVVENGAVLVYMIDGNGRDNQLPLAIPYEDEYPFVLENIRYDVIEGELTTIIECTDFLYAPRSMDIDFKVVVIRP